jgi:hypothetical protein
MTMERLEFEDGTTGYQYAAETRTDAMAASWEMANRPVNTGIDWTVDDFDEPDPDEFVLIEAGNLAELYRMARIGAQYAGCSTCRRVTLV